MLFASQKKITMSYRNLEHLEISFLVNYNQSRRKNRKIMKFIGHPFRNRKYRIGVGLKRSKRDQPFIRVTLHVRVHGLIFCLHKQDS